MSFRAVRTFLEKRLLEIDSDFEVYDKPFQDDDAVGNNDYDKRYHIFYGPVNTTVANQNTTQDQVSATVVLYFKGYRDSIEALDQSMDLANQYRINCLRIKFLKNENNIKRVFCTQINPEHLPTNDQAIRVSLTFNIDMIFGTNINLDC